jgi:sulfur-oxidizing protein SoxZ
MKAKAKGDIVEVKAIMKHPMETGLRKDKKTGKPIPAHFIQEINVEANGANVLNALWNGSVSTNPYLKFYYKGAKGDEVKLTWSDNQGETGEESTTVS